jgi:DNA polymerase
MHHIRLASETDFAGWRKAARALILQGIPPADTTWQVAGRDAELFAPTDIASSPGATAGFTVPKAFIELAATAILHRNPERFGLLYRMLHRLHGDPTLLQIPTDADLASLHALAKAVRRDEHKMHAFVRFREVKGESGSHFIAWFEPAHHIVELAASFFVNRFANMIWSILTPEQCAHWNGEDLLFSAGVPKSAAPSEDRVEDIWRSYYASIFNPARLKTKAMQAEMPKKYWRNLPEASLIRPLTEQAERMKRAMIAAEPATPRPVLQRKEPTMPRASKPETTLKRLHAEAEHCRACPLWKDATQVVFGEGPANAEIMFVGEQPGDKEDLAGKPFVGPAGQMFDRALKEAGIARDKTYVTNAVKHFKFVPRGKIRLHQKPSTPEIRACRQWYEAERATIRPALVVALGATAAQSVLGKAVTIGKVRGDIVETSDGVKALVTVHPSYLLRLPDADAQKREYAKFIDDLKIAARALKDLAKKDLAKKGTAQAA